MDNFDLKKYLAEGRLLREEMELEFFNNDEEVALIANSGEYTAEIEDGKVSFSVVYEDEDDRDGMEFDEDNWKSILGSNHAFVEIASKIPTEVEAIDDYVMITVNLEDLKGIVSLAEGKLLKEEETSQFIQDRLHDFIDELIALLSGWYLSYDMKPHDAWDNQIFASSAFRNKIKDKIKKQKGADKKEKMISFWKNSEKYYGMEGKKPSGSQKEDAVVFGKEVGKRTSLPDLLQIKKAISPGQSGGDREYSIIQSVTGMEPFDFFQKIK